MNRQFSPSHSKARTMRVGIAIAILTILFSVPVLRNGMRSGVNSVALGISRSVHGVGNWFGSIGGIFHTRVTLERENVELKSRINDLNTQLLTTNALLRENTELKSLLGRNANKTHAILATIISKPPTSLYDTLIIDAGKDNGIMVGQVVYANGSTPIGKIDHVSDRSSVVRLYSTSGEKTEARLSPNGVDVILEGRGGGNFSAEVLHDLVVDPSAIVVTKETSSHTIAYFKKITSDPRDPFQTLLLISPVNMHELHFVEVRQ